MESEVMHYSVDILTSYLSNRLQNVFIQNSSSSLNPIAVCVPQESILGPLLVLVYVYNLIYSVQSTPRLFADDTCLCAKSSPNNLEHIMNNEMKAISPWA